MKKGLIFAAALTLLSVPAFAQYGGGAQNAGGPAGSAARGMGVGSGGAPMTTTAKRKPVKKHYVKKTRRHRNM